MKNCSVILVLSFLTLSGCRNEHQKLGYEVEEEIIEEVLTSTPESKDDTVVVATIGKISENFYDGRIFLSYPYSWEIVQRNAKVTERTTVAVQIMQKPIYSCGFKPNINVIFSKGKHKESTATLASISYNQLDQAGYANALIGIKKCFVGGCYGSVAEFTAFVDEYMLHVFQYILKKKDNTTITITATLDHNDLSKQRKIADDIINSIVIY